MIITVQKAREILGSKYDYLSDEEIQKVIDDLYFFAKSIIERQAK